MTVQQYFIDLDTALIAYVNGHEAVYHAFKVKYGLAPPAGASPEAERGGVLKAATARTTLPQTVRAQAAALLAQMGMRPFPGDNT